MTDLQELLKPIEDRLEKATPGPWQMTLENPDGFPQVFLDEAKQVDLTIEDMNFIDSAPTDIAKLLEAVRVMDDALYCYSFGNELYEYRAAREARQKVRDILNDARSFGLSSEAYVDVCVDVLAAYESARKDAKC